MKTVALIIAVFATVACGYDTLHAPVYVTPCGLRVMGSEFDGSLPPGWDEASITLLEKIAVRRGLVKCEQLKGYDVLIRMQKSWVEYGTDYERVGSTWCNDVWPRTEISYKANCVLLHEVHHIAQNCAETYPVDPGQWPMHGDWDRTGATRAVRDGCQEFIDLTTVR